MKKAGFLLSFVVAGALAGCRGQGDPMSDGRVYDYKDIDFRSCSPFGPCYGAWQVSRPTRTSNQLVDAALDIAEACGDTNVAGSSLIPQPDIDAWANAAMANPLEWGVVGADSRGRSATFSYQYQTDTLRFDEVGLIPVPDPLPNHGVHDDQVGETAAEAEAWRVLGELESRGVVATGKFSTILERKERHGHVTGKGTWTNNFRFTFRQTLDGLPLLSSEVSVKVNAKTGKCMSVLLIDQDATRLGDTAPATTDETVAEGMIESLIQADYPATTSVTVDARIGYYLPKKYSGANLPPSAIGVWTTSIDRPEGKSVGSKHSVSLDLTDPAAQPVDIREDP